MNARVELLVADTRARWLDVERLAEEISDDELSFRVEQTMLNMLAVRDRLEQLQAADLVAELEQELAGVTMEELQRERYGDPDEMSA